MQVGVGYCDNPDSAVAGRQAAWMAMQKARRTDPCDMVMLFATARHNQQVLRAEVAATTGNSHCIYGGGAAGIITNEDFGYAGDQVGVACIWMEDSECTIVTEHDLVEGEIATGERLGKRLAEIGTLPDSSVLMFYDPVDRTQGDLRMLMATWLLEGVEKGLGFFPNLAGAGIQGDHVASSTQQYLGEQMDKHSVFAMKFSDDIRMDTVIMHGCRPGSPYYTVTKAEGSIILEINGEPAIPFVDKLLGSSITPEQYPFFLLFGINHGDRWGEYDENNYASRLCLGIDKERNGIVMFEPDMVAGTEFQIMYRSMGLEYMTPKINAVFDQLDGQEPMFAMYIDCGGRCAGYGGVDMEDAIVVQKAVNNRVPLLGLYTGVEIGSIGGRPRGLDWSGVFCVFSKRKPGDEISKNYESMPVWKNEALKEKDSDEIPLDAVVTMCQQNISKVLALDTESISIRHELEQKRRGFRLLAELSVSLRQGDNDESIFLPVTQRINGALNMQRTIVLFPDAEGRYIPSILQGYPEKEKAELAGRQIRLDAELLNPEKPVLVNGADSPERLAELRKILKLSYFISAPVIVKNEVAAILITGRTMEVMPYLSRLTYNDVETVQAISALLASVLVYQRLDDANKQARTDALTGLLNRGALESQTAEILQQGLQHGKMFAFIIIDFDYFKEINDTYGHMAGDKTLKTLAEILRNNFRSTDGIARIGGDEFVVFGGFTGDISQITRKVERLMESWNEITLTTENGSQYESTLSIGISIAPRDGVFYDDLYHKADLALYKSKQRGRNQYSVYDAKTMSDTQIQ